MRAQWSLIADRVLRLKKKVVVAFWVYSERGIIVHRTQGERSAAAPTPHHFGGQELPGFKIWGIFP